MNKIILAVFLFITSGCGYSATSADKVSTQLDIMTFEVVQKELIIDDNLPNNVEELIKKWFDNKVKINGFDGDMTFTISEFLEETSSISDGKRVDISLFFIVVLNKPSLSQTKMIEGYVSSYGTLSGNFSLAEFDTVIQNTQTDLVLRLSRDLKTKI